MITVYIGANYLENPPRVKFVTDRDCLPTDITHVDHRVHEGAGDTGNSYWFKHYREMAPVMEKMGMDVCIDFGEGLEYETA